MRTPSLRSTGLAAALLGLVLVLAACGVDDPDVGATPTGEATSEPSEPSEPATVPALMYAALADALDPDGEHLAPYDGSNDPETGVGAGKARGAGGGWSLNAEWDRGSDAQGLVGLTLTAGWPDGWVCADNYPGCRDIPVEGGGTARGLPAGKTYSVGYEQPDGDKVIVSVSGIKPRPADELLAAVVADERLTLAP